MWLLYAVGSALFAGLTSVLAKCGIRKTDSTVATAIRTIIVLIFAWVMVFVVGSQGTIASIPARSLVFLGLSGLATGAIKAKQYRCRRPEAYGINCSRAFSPRKFTDDSIDANHCFPLTGGTRTPICSEVGKIKTMWCPF